MGQTFGERGDELELLRTWVSQTRRCLRVARVDGQVAGLGMLTVTAEFDRSTYEQPFGVHLEELVGGEPVALFNQLVVAPGLRQRGVASALGRSMLAWLSGQRAGAALGVSWEHGGPHNSSHLFRRAGFRELGRCPGFYRRFQAESGQRCAVCGPRECSCVALLFGARVAELSSGRPVRQR